MAEPELEGASLPEGIEVDETSAYFGITESSDIVHDLMSTDKMSAIAQFFALVSDVVLKPGEFDFEEASRVLNCEGGEIYYLVSGHLGLMSFTDPLLHYLGETNSLGDESPNAKPNLSPEIIESLQLISKPMNMLKILAIGNNNGGESETLKYYSTLEDLFLDVASNVDTLASIGDEFAASLDVIGHSIPITGLANSNVEIKPISAPKPTKSEQESKPVAKPVESIPIPKQATSVALPVQEEAPAPSVPLPTASTPTPAVAEQPVIDKATEISERKAAKAADNAFGGAFGIIGGSEAPIEEEVLVSQAEIEEIESELSQVDNEPVVAPEEVLDGPNEDQDTDLEAVEEVFVSDAEVFIQADTDGDGTLSVEELSDATGLSTQEVQELHDKADKDDDGKVTLSEFIASPVAQKVKSSLPRPVAPVRRPVNRSNPAGQAKQEVTQPTTPQPRVPLNQPIPQAAPPQNIAPQPIRPQPIVNQQPQWNQQPQPTIRSGVYCRGCGIGIDPYWRFCPICGGQNLV